MKERTKPRIDTTDSGPSGLGDIFSAYGDAGAMATVAQGPYAEELPIAEMTVGEIRARYADRFDIAPHSQAEINNHPVTDSERLHAGQVLQFANRTGVKGAGGAASAKLAAACPPEALVSIEGPDVVAVSREGQTASMPLPTLLERVRPPRMDTCGVVLPHGVKMLFSRGNCTIWVHETAPRVYRLKWIAEGSADPAGREAKYRIVRVAFPYLVVIAVFSRSPTGRIGLTHANECFFATQSIASADDPLCYPALLNCSKFDPPDGKPLSWICTQYLDTAGLSAKADWNAAMRGGFRALLHCLLETGFNYSSEMHEATSWFSESSRVDPRLATVEAWEKATAKDPNFVGSVPWIPVGLSVGQIAERIFANHHASRAEVESAADVARVVFNQRSAGRDPRAASLFSGLSL